jgi:hypothetical protein
MEYITRLLDENTIKKTSELLNVSAGTVQRWVLLKKVPSEYTFDLMNLLGIPIDYSQFTYSQKNQYFTDKEIVNECMQIIRNEIPNYQEYLFVEPSAGNGSFIGNILNIPRIIAMDVEPMNEKITKQDYLTWLPDSKENKIIVFGNPPFGLRGHSALKFINHSAKFADYVCFILPQLFESDGKGSPRKRVDKGFGLVYSKKIEGGEYSTPGLNKIKINCVFQIWKRGDNNNNTNIPNIPNNIIIYSLSDGGTPGTTRNKELLNKCDIYLPSTCFGADKMKVYSSFEYLPGRKGYGVIFNDKKLVNKAMNTDWTSVAFLSTNSAYNLRRSLIQSVFE